MPEGKAAGVRCYNLADDYSCRIYNHTDYPDVCRRLIPANDICGDNRDEAVEYLSKLERITQP
jgi:hypothetical protein